MHVSRHITIQKLPHASQALTNEVDRSLDYASDRAHSIDLLALVIFS